MVNLHAFHFRLSSCRPSFSSCSSVFSFSSKENSPDLLPFPSSPCRSPRDPPPDFRHMAGATVGAITSAFVYPVTATANSGQMTMANNVSAGNMEQHRDLIRNGRIGKENKKLRILRFKTLSNLRFMLNLYNSESKVQK